MHTYCVSCKKNTESKGAKVIKTRNGRLMLNSACSVCGNKKSRFIKKKKQKEFYLFWGLQHLHQNYQV